MAFAAFATLASMLIMIGLRFITSLNGTRVSNRIVLVVFFMSHLLKSAWLMITISILSAPSINSMWQWHPLMRPGNSKCSSGGKNHGDTRRALQET